MKMIHKTELEIKMIQGGMAESLFTLTDTFKWLTRLMMVDEFQTKYNIVEFAKDFNKRVDELDDYITIVCQNIDDPMLKAVLDCCECSARSDAKFAAALAAKDKQ